MICAKTGCSFSRPCTGVALVLVLWLVAALTLLVVGLVGSTRAEVRGVQNVRLFAEHAALGDGAIRVGALRLLGAAEAQASLKFTHELDGLPIEVEAVPASAYVNLNYASVELLTDTFRFAAGLDEAWARTLAERIADWRDADDTPLVGGAENLVYEASGSPFRTRGGLFEGVDDLIQVLGLDLDLHDKIRGLFTVYGVSAGIDPRFAPAAVLTILARGDVSIVSHILAARERSDPLADTTMLTQQHLARGRERIYRIEAGRSLGKLRLVRSRWVDLGMGRTGEGWRELAAEPVRAEQISGALSGGH